MDSRVAEWIATLRSRISATLGPKILFDIAAEADSFTDFKTHCEEFLSSSQESLTKEWIEALEEVRRSGYVDPTLKSEQAGGHEVDFEVLELTPNMYDPGLNEIEPGLKAAA